eukprot:365613-Chlamydomonas_euryale.AAC.8
MIAPALRWLQSGLAGWWPGRRQWLACVSEHVLAPGVVSIGRPAKDNMHVSTAPNVPQSTARCGAGVQTSDTVFYEDPRFVYHIDDKAVGAITK